MSDQDRLAAILYIATKERMHILEVQMLARILGKMITFDLAGPNGHFRCIFSDPTYGIFDRIDGGAMHVKGFQLVSDIWCENLGDYA